MGEKPMTPEEAERAHLRGPEGRPDPGHRRMQELRKVGREYPFICPVDSMPHKGSPPGEDPNLDPRSSRTIAKTTARITSAEAC